MPLGFERLNERKQRPNSLINFIKPLPGSTSNYAQDFLERIAAICHPIMKANSIAVMSLEEFPPNPEFVGRNFNAGEIIQLVLKSRDGRWLPFRHVQMIMMHELAHCKQMNHSKAFWKVRDQYATELRELWGKSYTGDGFWGKGKTVLSAEYERQDMPPPELEPKSLCGGTYRTRGRKRKRSAAKEKEKVSYAERQQRRILKKFGAGGTALGSDETKKAALEGGKPAKGKPRVAGSQRGRELRAAAALARFEQTKSDQVKKEETDSGSEEDWDEYDLDDSSTVDFGGKEKLDPDGPGIVKICEGEDEQDGDAQRELRELYEVDGWRQQSLKEMGFLEKSEPENGPKVVTPTTTQCKTCSLINEPEALTCAACANVLDSKRLKDHWACASSGCRETGYHNAGDVGACGICGKPRPQKEVHVID